MGLPTAGKRDNHPDLPCPKIALYSVYINSQTLRLQYEWHKYESAGSFFPVCELVSTGKQPEAD
jgi:hypothetical protein